MSIRYYLVEGIIGAGIVYSLMLLPSDLALPNQKMVARSVSLSLMGALYLGAADGWWRKRYNGVHLPRRRGRVSAAWRRGVSVVDVT
jgi:hypothetical protein